MTTVLLPHGGLWEDAMDAERFWVRPGIVAGLQDRGLQVLAPDRPPRAPIWADEVDQLTPALPNRPLAVVAGSNGCSAAMRLALAHPDRVERLLLAWPATAGNPVVDAQLRSSLIGRGASLDAIEELLGGQTLRGVSDAELTMLGLPVGVLPSVPENLFHQRQTVDALCRLLPHAEELPGCPEPRPRLPCPPGLAPDDGYRIRGRPTNRQNLSSQVNHLATPRDGGLRGVPCAPRPRHRDQRVQALTRFGWTIPCLSRVELYIEPWNTSSIHVAEAAGYQREGLPCSHQEIGGTRRDVLLCAITRP